MEKEEFGKERCLTHHRVKTWFELYLPFSVAAWFLHCSVAWEDPLSQHLSMRKVLLVMNTIRRTYVCTYGRMYLCFQHCVSAL